MKITYQTFLVFILLALNVKCMKDQKTQKHKGFL